MNSTFFTEEEELGLLEITEEEVEEAKKRLTARASRNFKTQEVNEMTTMKTIRDCIEAFADSEYSQNSESFDEAMADEALKLYLGTLIELIKEKEATTNNEDLIKFILEKLESDKEQL